MNKANKESNHREEHGAEELPANVEVLRKRLIDVEKKAAERDDYYEKYVRLLADYDNARKRMQKETSDFYKFANERLIRELFPTLDSFDSAITGMEKDGKAKPFLDGLKLLQEQFHKVLESNGLSVMTSVGGKFDPIMHEAVMRVPAEGCDDGTITEELRKGYMLNGRVLRPAMVKVAYSDEGSVDVEEEKELGA